MFRSSILVCTRFCYLCNSNRTKLFFVSYTESDNTEWYLIFTAKLSNLPSCELSKKVSLRY